MKKNLFWTLIALLWMFSSYTFYKAHQLSKIKPKEPIYYEISGLIQVEGRFEQFTGFYASIVNTNVNFRADLAEDIACRLKVAPDQLHAVWTQTTKEKISNVKWNSEPCTNNITPVSILYFSDEGETVGLLRNSTNVTTITLTNSEKSGLFFAASTNIFELYGLNIDTNWDIWIYTDSY